MPNGVERQQPPHNPGESPSRLREGSDRNGYLIAWGSGLATIGTETKEPSLIFGGLSIAASGMYMNYNNSERAIKKTEGKINTLERLTEAPERETRESIIQASDNFIEGHREELLLSMGLTIIGGALIGHGANNLLRRNNLNLPFAYVAVGFLFAQYGQHVIDSSLKRAEKNIDDANAYIQRNNPNNHGGD
jgi:hypothetical protein